MIQFKSHVKWISLKCVIVNCSVVLSEWHRVYLMSGVRLVTINSAPKLFMFTYAHIFIQNKTDCLDKNVCVISLWIIPNASEH